MASDNSAAGCERNQRGHHADERAFTRAIGAQKPEYFTLGYRKADVFDGFKLSVSLKDILNRNRWGAHCFTSLVFGI
jgi:hypothetical protein